MFPPVFQTLKASQAVKDIVGSNPPRVYRHGAAPQDTERPFLTWFVISGVPENNLSDLPTNDLYSVQVDCWHQTDKGVELLAEAVRNAIEPHAHMIAVTVNLREDETQLFRIGMQFDFWTGRSS